MKVTVAYRIWISLLLSATLAGGIGAWMKLAGSPALHRVSSVTPAAMPDKPCWRIDLHFALEAIDPQRRMPLVVAELGDAWGRTHLDTGLVRIDPDVPCGQLAGVIAHEWAHWQQHRIYGSHRAAVAALDSIEVNADCVADFLVPGRRAYIGDRACTYAEIAAAKLTMRGLPA